MGILKRDSGKKGQLENDDSEKSIHVSNVKIDRNGQAWKYKTVWFRQEYLDKLKVMCHFEKKNEQQLIDIALEDFIRRRWNSSSAMKKMVEQSTDKGQKVQK
jgi:hypothetical protein